jgi:hypothetical protein
MTQPTKFADAPADSNPPLSAPLVPEGEPSPPVATPSGATDPKLARLHMFLQAARDPQIDAAKLKELRAMAKEDDDADAKRAYFDAKARAKGEFPPIIKTHLVDYAHKDGRGRTTYKHEDLFDITQVVDPILAKYGLSYSHRVTQESDKMRVTCIFAHADGYSEEFSLNGFADTSGQKSPNQAITSTVTFMQRATLKQALGLAAGRDDDGAGGEDPDQALIDGDQLVQVQQLLKETESDLAIFFDTLGATGFSDLTVAQWKRGVALLNEKKRRAAQKAATL